ncbi:hypothetical protein BTHI11S_02052 [Bosea thiooxidans]
MSGTQQQAGLSVAFDGIVKRFGPVQVRTASPSRSSPAASTGCSARTAPASRL